MWKISQALKLTGMELDEPSPVPQNYNTQLRILLQNQIMPRTTHQAPETNPELL